ncbi:MAG: trigger factor [Pseudomonadota bacterium]
MTELNYKLEDISSVSKKLKVEVPYERVKAGVDKAIDTAARTASIKGFRQGKAPRSVIEKQYSDSILHDVAEKLIGETYLEILKEKNIHPAGYPKITDVVIKDGQPLTYQAEIEVAPHVVPKGYEGAELKGIPTEPTDDEVEKIVIGFLDSRADMKTVEDGRPVSKSDWVDIDMEGFVDGQSRKDLTVKAYVCEIGNKMSLIDDISNGVKGMKAGEEKDIKSKYADDYYAEELRGKEVLFKVKLNKILERLIPELTDELVKEAKIATGKDEFLKNVKENLRKRKQEVRDGDLRNQLMNILLEENNFDVPPSEVEKKLPEVKERAVRNMFGYRAHSMPEKEINEALSKYDADIKKAAENDVRISYILDAIAQKHSITPTKEEIKNEMELTARSMKLTVDKLREKYGEHLLEQILGRGVTERKTLDYLCGQAKIVGVKK